MFLDQTSRNFVWACCSSTDCASLRQACNVVALPLALSVLANVGESIDGKGFLAIASPVECCFLSLVLRHTCLPVFVGVAEKILKAVLTTTLTVTSCLQFCSSPKWRSCYVNVFCRKCVMLLTPFLLKIISVTLSLATSLYCLKDLRACLQGDAVFWAFPKSTPW